MPLAIGTRVVVSRPDSPRNYRAGQVGVVDDTYVYHPPPPRDPAKEARKPDVPGVWVEFPHGPPGFDGNPRMYLFESEVEVIE